jgi:hypothetical protein
MKPKPLLGILTNPPLDDVGDQLRGGGNVDAAIRVTRKCQRSFRRNAEPTIRQPDYAHADDGTIELTSEAGDGGIGLAAAA